MTGLAACAVSAPGGLVGTLVALLVAGRPAAGTRSAAVRRAAGVAAVAALLNAPWWVVGLARGGAAASDPAGVVAFAARDEGYGGVLPTLLTLGGIWNAGVVPDSRGTLPAVLGALVLAALVLAGARRWWWHDRGAALPGGPAQCWPAPSGATAGSGSTPPASPRSR